MKPGTRLQIGSVEWLIDVRGLESNLEESFRPFRQEVDIYFTAMETDTKDEKMKIASVEFSWCWSIQVIQYF